MGLKDTFLTGVNQIFAVFADFVKTATYIVETDDGWDNVSSTSYSVRVILDKFLQEDIDRSSFSALIQPTDVKGLIPGIDLTVPMNTGNTLSVEDRNFEIVAFETDPIEALFTLLLRDTQ